MNPYPLIERYRFRILALDTSPPPLPPQKPHVAVAFLDRLAVALDSPLINGYRCLVYTGARTSRGYGHVRNGSVSVGAHRLVWEMVNSKIPAGMVVMHACDNPPCCRIEHLSLGTQKDNMEDAAQKGRMGKKDRAGG